MAIDLDWDGLLGRAWDTLDRAGDRKADLKKDGRKRDNERYRDITDRQDRKRDDDIDIEEKRGRLRRDENRDKLQFGNERYRDVTDRGDRLRDDQLDELDLTLSDGRARMEGKRADRRAQYQQQTERTRQTKEDARALIKTRSGVYKDALESRRGDTIVSRIMWPAALAAGVYFGVQMINKRAGA